MKPALLSFFLISCLLVSGQQPAFHSLLHLYQTMNEADFKSDPSRAISELGFHSTKSSGKHRLSFQNDTGDYLHLIRNKKECTAIACTTVNDSSFAEWVRSLIIDGYKLTKQYVRKNDPYSLYEKDGITVTVRKQYNSSPQIEYSLEIKQSVKNFQ